MFRTAAGLDTTLNIYRREIYVCVKVDSRATAPRIRCQEMKYIASKTRAATSFILLYLIVFFHINYAVV